MAKIPEPVTTLSLLDKQKTVSYGRPYLGMSSIGTDCERKLWYGLHWVVKKETSARTNRIFSDGHNAEAGIISDLKRIGYEVYRICPITGDEIEMTGEVGEEQEEMIGFGGHAKGHNDGRVRGVIESPKTPHLLEMKTANDKSFKDTQSKGVQRAKPVYYAQCQRYMHDLKLTRTLFVMKNKNDSSYYIERIKYDRDFALDLIRKEREIIISDAPPTKRFNDTWYECKWCDDKDVCHDGKEPEKNCRTCEFADMEDNGIWTCQKQNDRALDIEEQKAGCKLYRKGWGL